MAFDETLAQRIRTILAADARLTERRMFGGVAFMIGGNMAVGIVRDDLMVRVGPDGHDAALAEPHARPMDFGGRPSRGMVYVGPDGTASDVDLERWVQTGVAFAGSLPAK
jgi:TfoX/Sxy family transcriptional regulator of competence genes